MEPKGPFKIKNCTTPVQTSGSSCLALPLMAIFFFFLQFFFLGHRWASQSGFSMCSPQFFEICSKFSLNSNKVLLLQSFGCSWKVMTFLPKSPSFLDYYFFKSSIFHIKFPKTTPPFMASSNQCRPVIEFWLNYQLNYQ